MKKVFLLGLVFLALSGCEELYIENSYTPYTRTERVVHRTQVVAKEDSACEIATSNALRKCRDIVTHFEAEDCENAKQITRAACNQPSVKTVPVIKTVKRTVVRPVVHTAPIRTVKTTTTVRPVIKETVKSTSDSACSIATSNALNKCKDNITPMQKENCHNAKNIARTACN